MTDIVSFLQSKGYSRRTIIRLLQHSLIKKNSNIITYRKEGLQRGDIVEIDTTNTERYIVEGIVDTYDIILFNKPVGYVVSKFDEHNNTIYTILPEGRDKKYNYIGRLDKDSHGLLVLTNATKLVSFFSHPRYQHTKIYHIITDRVILPEDIKKGKTGIYYYDNDEKKDIYLSWESCTSLGDNTYEICINEGKKRHIRRLCEALHYSVVDLMRVQFGPWKIGNLREGERHTVSISSSDVESLLASQNSYTQTQI